MFQSRILKKFSLSASTRFSFFFCLCALFILGSISALSMPPASLWPCLFIGISLFYVLYSFCKTPARACASGFTFALGYFLTGLWWIGNALLVEGNEYKWVWPLAVIGLPVLLSFFTAIAIGCAKIIAPDAKKFTGFATFIICLGLSEWVRGYIFTGFPWNLYGYVWSEILSIAQIAYLVGPFGLTLVTLFWATSLGFLYLSEMPVKQKILFTLILFLSFTASFGYGSQRLASHPTQYNENIVINIVQPNIPQHEKWDGEKLVSNFEKHLSLSYYRHDETSNTLTSTAKKHLIVWPETALYPAFLESPAVFERLDSVLSSYPGQATLLTGALTREQTGDEITYSNALMRYETNTKFQKLYSKSHLVPFGEYIPFQNYIPLKPVAQFQGFEKGPGVVSLTVSDIPAFTPLICYEIIFPPQNLGTLSLKPEWILTVTNDAWYGESAGPYQHFSHAIFRAIETGLPVIRSANTGISGIVDAYGRTLEKSRLNENWHTQSYLPKAIEQRSSLHLNKSFIFICFCLVVLIVTRAISPLQNN
jgi:apolipoprotein N-acyltransferase